MIEELKEREAAIVEQKEAEDHVYPSRERRRRTSPAQSAKNPKKSKRYDKRSLILTNSLETKK